MERRNSILVALSTGVNAFGDILLDIYISWSLGATSGNFMNGVYVIATSVGFRALLSFFLGSYTDKHKKKSQMIFSHILSLTAVVFFAVLWNNVNNVIAVGLVFILVNDFSNELLHRSRTSMMADMLSTNGFIRFQNSSGVITRIVSTGGAGLAGFFVDKLSFDSIIIIDVFTYLVSMLAILLVNYTEGPIICGSDSPLQSIVSDFMYTARKLLNSRFIRSFVIIMIVLNLAYGFIPNAFPLIKSSDFSAGLYGTIKAGITIGEILGLILATRYSRYVSRLFTVGLSTNVIVLLCICIIDNPAVLVVMFTFYGLFDSLTQPLFSYTVCKLDPQNRGKLLGGIDSIIMLSPSVGILFLSNAFSFSPIIGAACLSAIFLFGLVVFLVSPELNKIDLDSAGGVDVSN